MNKLEQAARQLLEVAEGIQHGTDWNNGTHAKIYRQKFPEAITALREALDHSGEANEMVVGWDRAKPEAIASDPLYQQGFVDGVEEGRNQVAEQAEQEPVAWNDLDEDELAHKLGWRIGDPLYMTIVGIGQEAIRHFKAQNTAPVRTKDLTDDEIRFWIGRFPFLLNEKSEKWVIGLARAVIAADREKNK